MDPTYTETNDLTIEADTTLSAPRGTFDLSGDLDINGTYTHNSGTFSIDSTAGQNALTPGGAVFYNLTSTGSANSNHVAQESFGVENMFNVYRQFTVDKGTLTMGTTGASGFISGNAAGFGDGDGSSYLGVSSGDYINLYAVNELYPVEISNDCLNWGVSPNPTWNLKWTNHLVEVNTQWASWNTAEPTIKLDGACSFQGFTVSADHTLDLNGERMECSGVFQNLSIVKGDYSSTNKISTLYCACFSGTAAGPVTDFGYTDVIITGLGSNNANDFYSFHSYGVNNAVINTADDPDSYPINMPGTRRMLSGDGDNLIIAQGGWQSDNFTVGGNLIITDGGKFNARIYDYTLNGDMIMSGGLIGKGALDFEEQGYVDLTNDSAWQFGTDDFTLEAWFRSDVNTGLNRTFIANGDAGHNGFLLYMQADGNIKLYVNNIAAVNAPGPYENTDVWHHVAAVRNGNVYSIYIDGKLIDQNTLAAQDLTHAGAASIGARDISNTANAFFNGQIAMIRVFKGTDGARTEQQIRADMFNNFASMADDTDLLAMYQFDEMSGGYGTTIVNMEGTTALDGTLEPSGYAPNWAGPGNFDYDTSTLKFEKAGTCSFYGTQDGSTETEVGALTITNGTTLNYYLRDKDFTVHGLLTNSGTFWGNRSFQYYNHQMPIVDASSDLTVGSNYFYYNPTSSAIISGAATTYNQLTTRAGGGDTGKVVMQGDFTVDSIIYPYSDGQIHFNGYKGTINSFSSYASGKYHS